MFGKVLSAAGGLLGLGGGGGGNGGTAPAPQAPGMGFNPGQLAALANLQQFAQGPYQQNPGQGPVGSDMYGFEGGGLRLPGPAIGPQLSQAPGGMYGDREPGGLYDLRTPVPVDEAPGGLLDDPNPNMADRFKQLGGMVSEGPKNQYLQPPAAPGIGGGTGFDITPYMRRGIRPVR